jgi:release factor glutamine methyltransferase
MIYRGVELELYPNVYRPSDDSYLLADNIQIKKGEKVLDMGTGCGIQGIIASKMGGVVTSSDISSDAIKCARKNAESNDANITFVKSDIFNDIEDEFDLIMFNPPYLPTEHGNAGDEREKALDGGETGKEVTLMFLEELKNHLSHDGRALLVTSTLSIPENPGDIFSKHGLAYKIVDEKPLFFERLYIYMILR